MGVEVTIAKIWAIYYVVITLWSVMRRNELAKLIKTLVNSPGYNFISGFITLGLGTVLIVNYSYWVIDWRLGLTIIHWMVFLKGILLLFFSSSIVSLSFSVLKKKWACNLFLVLSFFLGLLFFYYGFIYDI